MTLKVRDVMTSDVETLFVGETMDLADTIIKLGRIRHLPITDREGKLVGLLTHRDLLRALAELNRQGRSSSADRERVDVSEIMTAPVTTVAADDSLLSAAELIWERKIGCVPVVENGYVVGILTESDFVHATIMRLR